MPACSVSSFAKLLQTSGISAILSMNEETDFNAYMQLCAMSKTQMDFEELLSSEAESPPDENRRAAKEIYTPDQEYVTMADHSYTSQGYSSEEWIAQSIAPQSFKESSSNHVVPIQQPVQLTPAVTMPKMLTFDRHQDAADVDQKNFHHHNHRFLYVLEAPSSPATKTTDDPITFLNQGQSYEVGLTQLDFSDLEPSTLRTTIRITFNDRRLRVAEREQLQLWRQHHGPNDRLVELDIPLCFGVKAVSPVLDGMGSLSTVGFMWGGHQKATVSLKLNCISTEFTAKRSGGEKGVPFRIQVETYRMTTDLENKEPQLIHCAYCLVKVFKPKGAERKQKIDLEWFNRLPELSQLLYRPALEKTHFMEVPISAVTEYLNTFHLQSNLILNRSSSSQSFLQNQSISSTEFHISTLPPDLSELVEYPRNKSESSLAVFSLHSFSDDNIAAMQVCEKIPLKVASTAEEVKLWLKQNQFDSLISVLHDYNGADLFQLSRRDFVDICGIAQGIRLCNAVHNVPFRSVRKIFVLPEPINRLPEDSFHRPAKMTRHGSCESFGTLSPFSSRGSSSGSPSGSCIAYPLSSMLKSIDSPSVPSPYHHVSAENEKNHSQFQRKSEKRSHDAIDDASDSVADQFQLKYGQEYHFLSLDCLTRDHLIERLGALYKIRPNQITKFCLILNDIQVTVTDMVVSKLEHECRLKLEVIQVTNGTQPTYFFLLRPNSTETRKTKVLV